MLRFWARRSRATYIQFQNLTPPQSRSQAVVCVTLIIFSCFKIFLIFQRFLLSITPEKEQKDIIEGKPGSRASINHWISL